MVLPLYKPYVPPQRVRFLHCFGLKMGIDYAQFGLESGMNIPNELERNENMQIWNRVKEIFFVAVLI